MTKPAAIAASLVDVRNIAAHKCVRLEIHVPVEQAAAVMQAFGWPTMAEPVPVAIARIATEPAGEPVKEKRRFGELQIAQQAALLCNRAAFWTFLSDRKVQDTVDNQEQAASIVRGICGVGSRSELATNARAAAKFTELNLEFETWLSEPL